MRSRPVISWVSSRRLSNTLILVSPRWLGTVVGVEAADMAATVAAAVVDSVVVSV
jgi:hypothetical protein